MELMSLEPYVHGNISMGFLVFFRKPTFKGTYLLFNTASVTGIQTQPYCTIMKNFLPKVIYFGLFLSLTAMRIILITVGPATFRKLSLFSFLSCLQCKQYFPSRTGLLHPLFLHFFNSALFIGLSLQANNCIFVFLFNKSYATVNQLHRNRLKIFWN